VKSAGHDCGTFIMDYIKAAGGCNNACHHMHCVNPVTATMVYFTSPLTLCIRSVILNFSLIDLDTIPPIAMTEIKGCPAMKQLMAAFATRCPSI